MDKKIALIIIAVLVALLALLGWRYFWAQTRLAEAEAALAEVKLGSEVVAFADLFVREVLKAEGEVSFETRLKLETAVRDLKNERVLAGWQRFIASQTELEAQAAVKDLLGILIGEIGR